MNEAVTSLAPDAPEKAPKATPLQAAEKNSASLLPATYCKTFGEKAFSGVFDWGINFGLNLAVSAAFSHWVAHSSRPIWKNAPDVDFLRNLRLAPETLRDNVRDSIKNGWLTKSFNLSNDIASRMTDALTLTMGGHFIMVPSVWLGAKCKLGFVEALDNWHYGKDNADRDPWLQARHKAVQQEAKPTFLGTVVGRLGTMGAVQIASISLGAEKNMITKLGDATGRKSLQEFKGLNHISKTFGHAFGKGFQDAAPKLSNYADGVARRAGFVHSAEQLQEDAKLIAGPGHYKDVIADYSKYTALDTFYTVVTMFTIHPIINMAKSVLPGMTYHDKPVEKPDTQVSSVKSAGKISYPELSQGVSA